MPAALSRILIGALLAGGCLASALHAGDPIDTPLTPPNPAPRPEEPGGTVPEPPGWAGIKPGDRERRKLTNQSDLDWAFLKSEFVWRAPEPGHDAPFERGEWSTQDHLAIPVTGPLHLFTELSLGGDYGVDQSMTVMGKTGLLWKVSLGEGAPLEVRGGPALKYNDPLHPLKAKDQAAVLWELKAKAPLLGPIGLEYLGVAAPAMTPDDHSQLKQDLGVFLPISGGKLKLGAKHTWDATQQEVRTSTGLMEWYLGIEIGR